MVGLRFNLARLAGLSTVVTDAHDSPPFDYGRIAEATNRIHAQNECGPFSRGSNLTRGHALALPRAR